MLLRQFMIAVCCAALGVAFLAGCGAAPQAPQGAEGVATAAAATAEGIAPTAAAVATAVAPTVAAIATEVAPTAAAAATAVTGGLSGAVPEASVAAALTDLAGRLGAAPDTISLVTAEAISWPDGALGCPQPGMMYPQVITEGYRVVFAVNGQEYAYHGSTNGELVYCENPAS